MARIDAAAVAQTPPRNADRLQAQLDQVRQLCLAAVTSYAKPGTIGELTAAQIATVYVHEVLAVLDGPA